MRTSKNSVFCLFLLSLFPGLMHAGERSHMRGERYCEIFLSQSLTKFTVYNTIGLNNCPENIWKKINVAEVKKETGASRVHLNGPRYWVIDGIKNSQLKSPNTKTIGGLPMHEAATLNMSFSDLLHAGAPYSQHKVARDTTWVYNKGKPVYELIDPQGNVFVMQSYSIEKVPQTQQSLAQLGSKLKLPSKWQFKTGVLKQSDTVQAVNNIAVVVQDEFLNTYQKATHDLLIK